MDILTKRMRNEIKILKRECDSSKFLCTSIKNTREFNGFVTGPEASLYNGFAFEIVVRINDNYPFNPPVIYFKTKIFHPNIHFGTGEVCLDIIKNRWKPSFNLTSLLDCLKVLLKEPNADSPLNCDAGKINMFSILTFFTIIN